MRLLLEAVESSGAVGVNSRSTSAIGAVWGDSSRLAPTARQRTGAVSEDPSSCQEYTQLFPKVEHHAWAGSGVRAHHFAPSDTTRSAVDRDMRRVRPGGTGAEHSSARPGGSALAEILGAWAEGSIRAALVNACHSRLRAASVIDGPRRHRHNRPATTSVRLTL